MSRVWEASLRWQGPIIVFRKGVGDGTAAAAQQNWWEKILKSPTEHTLNFSNTLWFKVSDEMILGCRQGGYHASVLGPIARETWPFRISQPNISGSESKVQWCGRHIHFLRGKYRFERGCSMGQLVWNGQQSYWKKSVKLRGKEWKKESNTKR